MAKKKKDLSKQIVRYGSISEFVTPIRNSFDFGSGKWTGYQSFEQAKENWHKGDADVIARSSAILEQIESESIGSTRHQWVNDVAGFIPCVPSFVAGAPESMRRRESITSASAPLRVFLSVGMSEGYGPDKIEARGVAILALCRKLSEVRPVELYLFCDMYGHGGLTTPIIHVPTSPLDLASASYAVANAAFLRHLVLNWAKNDDRGYDHKFAYHMRPSPETVEMLRRDFNADPTDLIIPGGHLTDEMVSRPVEWVNKQVALHCGTVAA